jgi:hypothetical protein
LSREITENTENYGDCHTKIEMSAFKDVGLFFLKGDGMTGEDIVIRIRKGARRLHVIWEGLMGGSKTKRGCRYPVIRHSTDMKDRGEDTKPRGHRNCPRSTTGEGEEEGRESEELIP